MHKLIFLIALIASSASASAAPFFNQGNAFSSQIDVVYSGALLDAQAVVSPDRKYVTINARPQVSSIVAIREFTFQKGVVGLSRGILNQEGMRKIN